MSAPDAAPTDDRPLGQIVSDMEIPLSDLRGWSEVIRALAESDHDVPTEALHVIGQAIHRVADAAFADWRRVFDLTRITGGHP